MENLPNPEKSISFRKSKNFAIKIIRIYQNLCKKPEYVLSKQLLRSGTSIGANIAESQMAQSPNDFLAKIYIALKETSETRYWLELLHETGYLSDEEFRAIYSDCLELQRMLSKTTNTLSQKLKSSKK